jgi:catechol 2,3-dioxygenase-like lactoylglutathione lyase family enzyme
MSGKTEELAPTVEAMRPFVPAKDFAVSKHFYEDLGFRSESLGDGLAEMHLGSYSFLLQDYYVEQWAGNFMMHMLVTDLDRWWDHIQTLDLGARYGVSDVKPPKLESWGLNVCYVVDPSGVLWHIAELPRRDNSG